MKNGKTKKILMLFFLGLFTITVASGCSCTSSMCSSQDEQSIRNQIEKNNIEEWRNTARLSGMKTETDEYEAYANAKVEEIYLTSACGISGDCSEEEISAAKETIKRENNNKWLNELESIPSDQKGFIETRTDNFKEYVNNQVNSLYDAHPKACLVIKDDIDPDTGAKLEAKSWKDAWQTGFLEGLIVYPFSWILSTFTGLFGGTGIAQILAILLVVIIIRILMLLLNFKGQISSIKMQSIQGEISSLSEKLKDPNLTQQEKQMLSMKVMDIYKKNDIHPISSMVSQFISFPIFIAIWAAMNQTLAIRKGTLLGLSFGQAINSQIFKGSITAIVLFALMIAGQIITMKLPTWLRERKNKKENPHYKKEKNSTEKQMNIMMGVMVGLVIISGFLLPAALVIYWFFGSLFSILQTLVFNTKFVTEKLNSLANRKKKAKVVR